MGFGDTTLALPPELKEQIRSLKVIPEETFPNVLRRLIEEAGKVPGLEKEISDLKNENEMLLDELNKFNERLDCGILKTENVIEELNGRIAKLKQEKEEK